MNEEKQRMISDWFFKEFAPTWLELAGLTLQAEDARANGTRADWGATVRAAKELARAESEEAARCEVLGWNEARTGAALAGTDASRLAGSDVADELADVASYNEVIDAVSAALTAVAFAAAVIAAGEAFLESRSRGILRFFWSLISGSAKREAHQAAYEAAFKRLYPTAETLHWRVNELLRTLE